MLSFLKTTSVGKDNKRDVDTVYEEERFGDSISHCVEVSASVTTMENIGDKK